jgi:hypothetical protein
MYRLPTKRRQLIVRSLIYAAMTLSVVVLVTVLVFIMLGYRFNGDTSSIEQGGLVQFDSQPDGAHITIGRAQLSKTTPGKITVNPGNYLATMSREGYQGWSKNVTVRAGHVLWLNYATLVPDRIETQPLLTLPAAAQAVASPDGKYMAVVPKTSAPNLTLLELGDNPKQTSLKIPASLLPTAKASYRIQSWSADSAKLLLRAATKKDTRWLLVDRRDTSKTVDLSADEPDIKDVFFDPRSHDRVFALSQSGELLFIDTTEKTPQSLVSGGVQSVSFLNDSALVYVQKLSRTERSVDYITLGSSHAREIKRIQTKQTVLAAAGSYFSTPYLALADGPALEVYQLDRLPDSDSDNALSQKLVLSKRLPGSATHLAIRTGGRFVVAQYARGFATYDIEVGNFTVTDLKQTLASELRWLDRYHIYTTNGKSLALMEFDGANQHRIVDLSTDFDASQSGNGTYIYSLDKTTDGYVLQRSRLILR